MENDYKEKDFSLKILFRKLFPNEVIILINNVRATVYTVFMSQPIFSYIFCFSANQFKKKTLSDIEPNYYVFKLLIIFGSIFLPNVRQCKKFQLTLFILYV